MGKYIPKQNAIHLIEFKYTGGTSSITYEYIWSPLAQFLLKFTPKWIAPNVITLTALIILIICHILCMMPDQKYVAPWKLVITALSIFLYQQLDNMDGKQARRTKSSSPLGMIFDHGTDAFVAYFIGLQAMKLFHLDYRFQISLIPVFLMSQYFCVMWSQYCIGYFKLGRVNPVDEGLPMYALLFLVGSQIDLSIMDKFHWVAPYGYEFIYGLIFLLIPQLFFMSKDIFSKSKLPKSQIFLMTTLYFISAGSVLLTLNRIPHLTDTTFFSFYYAIMFMWCRNMILIQVQFITKQKYRVLNRGTVSFVVLTVPYILFRQMIPVSEQTYFLALCVIQALVFFEFIVSVFKEGSEILGIYVFKLGKREKSE